MGKLILIWVSTGLILPLDTEGSSTLRIIIKANKAIVTNRVIYSPNAILLTLRVFFFYR